MNHLESACADECAAIGTKSAAGTIWHDDCFHSGVLRAEGASGNDEPDAGEGVHHHNEGRDMEKYCAGNGVNDGSVEPAERLTDREIEEGIAANEGLVHRIVGKLTGKWGPDQDEDLVQEGFIGLWEALRQYNRRLGYAQSTYAGVCIRNRILDELKRRKRYGDFFAGSLQDPAYGEDGEATRGDFMPDEKAAGPDDALAAREMREVVLRGVAELPPRDREVVELRYGLRDGTCRSQREIAEAQDVTDQRISTIHRRAIERLRRPIERLEAPLEDLRGPDPAA